MFLETIKSAEGFVYIGKVQTVIVREIEYATYRM